MTSTAARNNPGRTDSGVERWRVLIDLERWLETPMLILSFIWLLLLVTELTWGAVALFETIGTVIWTMFLAEFALRFTLAPAKLRVLARNWFTLISLALPALRLLRVARVLRAARAMRGLRLVKVVGGVNRGMAALRGTLGRRRFGYVLALTAVIVFVGAAGMLAFEPRGSSADGTGFANYADALWWTAMVVTTMGSQYWPQSAEGRVLCFLLALYAFAVFGYVTAALASFFIGRDVDTGQPPSDLAALRRELQLLRTEIRAGQTGQGSSQ